MIRLFVYGTLKRGKYNNGWFGTKATFVKSAWVYGELYRQGLPYLFKGKDKIEGEVWDVPKDLYKSISNMEYSAGYYEGGIDAHFDDGTVETVRVFYYSQTWFDKSKADKILCF